MTESYDIVVASPFANYDFFSHKMRELCGQWSLDFFMVDDVWVNEFLQKLQSREISVRVLFDLTANQVLEDDIYLKLAREVKGCPTRSYGTLCGSSSMKPCGWSKRGRGSSTKT